MNIQWPWSLLSIDTQSVQVNSYIKQLFGNVDGNESDFIDNLSKPLLRNPLEILMHLQNV